MKNIIANLILMLPVIVFTSCAESDPDIEVTDSPARYEETVFDGYTLTTDIFYGSNNTQGGETQDLLFDFYEPEGDTALSRPLLIYAFGGGFVDGDKSEAEFMAPFFARSGYAVAAIDYRVLDIERTSENVVKAVFDAASDMKAAVRFLRANAATFKIDSANIFVGGYSAGAFTALQLGYVTDSSDIESISPALAEYVSENGGIEGTSGTPGVSSQVKGIFNFSGALLRADFIDADEPILFSVHGSEDEVVPINEGESDGTGVVTEGSGLLHQVANAVGLTNQLVIVDGAGHEAPIECENCLGVMRAFLAENL